MKTRERRHWLCDVPPDGPAATPLLRAGSVFVWVGRHDEFRLHQPRHGTGGNKTAFRSVHLNEGNARVAPLRRHPQEAL